MADGKRTRLNPGAFLSRDEKKKIAEKIREIESKSHTKIVIKVIRSHPDGLYHQAVKEFSRRKLHHEKIKTGILVLISLSARRFQILGDEHIHEKIGEQGWNRLAGELSEHFKEGRFFEGLRSLLTRLQEKLEEHFSRTTPHKQYID